MISSDIYMFANVMINSFVSSTTDAQNGPQISFSSVTQMADIWRVKNNIV